MSMAGFEPGLAIKEIKKSTIIHCTMQPLNIDTQLPYMIYVISEKQSPCPRHDTRA